MRYYVFLMITMLASGIGATNYYVAPTGSNSAKGTTVDAPFLTIQKAAQVAKAGDTIFVAPGVYSERNIKPTNSGSQAKGQIVFIAQRTSGNVIMSKTTIVADDATPVFDISERSYIRIEGFEFCNMEYLLNCIKMTKAQQCVVTGCKFCNLGHTEVNGNWGGGTMIWAYNASECIVSNCFFQNVTGGGIDIIGQEAQRNLICHNTFENLKGKKASWDETGKNHFSSGISISDTSHGDNVCCFNHFKGGQDGVWLDRDGSQNFILRNFGDGGQRLIFNESRCARNLFQENIAANMTESGYRSALYDGTNWSFDSRYVNNVAYKCKVGFYMHKSKHNEFRNNIAFASSNYCLLFTDSAARYGQNYFRNNLWHIASKNAIIQYCGKVITGAQFAQQARETGGIYRKSPLFVRAISPYDFTLQEGSPCQGAGDEGGVDVGAYPVYGPYPVGIDSLHQSQGPQPCFDALVTETLRGETCTVIVRLDQSCATSVTVTLTPVAGDLREGIDFVLSTSEITFQPGETEQQIEVTFMGEETEFSKLLVLKLTPTTVQGTASDVVTTRAYTTFKLMTLAEVERKAHTDLWIEAEGGTLGTLWNVSSDSRASDGKYIAVKNGNNANDATPAETGWGTYTFDITVPNTYDLWMRTICPSPNDDSFWIRMDNGDWSYWNGIPASTAWQWNKSTKSFYLLEGKHTLQIAYREDGAKLDKMLLTCNGTQPEGMGGSSTAILQPLMSSDTTGPTTYYIYSMTGQIVGQTIANSFREALYKVNVRPDVYIVKCVKDNQVMTTKQIKR